METPAAAVCMQLQLNVQTLCAKGAGFCGPAQPGCLGDTWHVQRPGGQKLSYTVVCAGAFRRPACGVGRAAVRACVQGWHHEVRLSKRSTRVQRRAGRPELSHMRTPM